MCPVGVVDGLQCDWGGTFPPSVTSDASGAFSTTFDVRRVITIAGTALDCAATPCWIGAGDIEQTRVAQAEIDFEGSSPPVVTFAAAPADASGDVAVEATGLRPSSSAEVVQCGPGATSAADCMFLASVFPTGAGSTSAEVRVARDVLALGPAGPQAVDCAVAACTLRLRGSDPIGLPVEAAAPLDLGALAPTPVTVTASPGGPYADGTGVEVSGSGFAPDRLVTVRACAATPDLLRRCPLEEVHAADTDASGGFALDVTVRRDVLVTDAAGSRAVDCAVEQCVLVVEGAVEPGVVRRVVLPLDVTGGSRPPVAPVLTADPVPGSGSEMTIHGEGFPLGGRYRIDLCTTSGDCTRDAVLEVSPDGTGSFTEVAAVPDEVPVVSASCWVVSCVLQASLPGVVVVRSDPLVPVGVPLTTTIEAIRTLDAGTGEAVVRASIACTEPTPVSVQGHIRQPGAAGGHTLEGLSCAPGAPVDVFVPTRVFDERDAALALGPAEVEVRAAPLDRYVDAAATSSTATVTLLDAGQTAAALVAAILADPGDTTLRDELLRAIVTRAVQDPVFGWAFATGAGPPAITAAPTTGLADGQPVHLEGSWFLPGTTVYAVQCPARVRDGRDCFTGGAFPPSAVTDGMGRFSLDVAARTSITAVVDDEVTTIDCTVEDCVLAVGDLGGARTVRVPLAFAPT